MAPASPSSRRVRRPGVSMMQAPPGVRCSVRDGGGVAAAAVALRVPPVDLHVVRPAARWSACSCRRRWSPAAPACCRRQPGRQRRRGRRPGAPSTATATVSGGSSACTSRRRAARRSAHRSALVSTTTAPTRPGAPAPGSAPAGAGLKSWSRPITSSAVSTLLTITVRVTLSRPSCRRRAICVAGGTRSCTHHWPCTLRSASTQSPTASASRDCSRAKWIASNMDVSVTFVKVQGSRTAPQGAAGDGGFTKARGRDLARSRPHGHAGRRREARLEQARGAASHGAGRVLGGHVGLLWRVEQVRGRDFARAAWQRQPPGTGDFRHEPHAASRSGGRIPACSPFSPTRRRRILPDMRRPLRSAVAAPQALVRQPIERTRS
jgi:hypothetical protein